MLPGGCTLEGIAAFMRARLDCCEGEGRSLKVMVLAGAGVSVAAGIPDFRSPKTGLYASEVRCEFAQPALSPPLLSCLWLAARNPRKGTIT